MSDAPIRQLSLEVKDATISWRVDKGRLDGYTSNLAKNDEPFVWDERRAETIELLISLLQLLTDLLRDRPLSDDNPIYIEAQDAFNRLVRILGEQLYEVLFAGTIGMLLEQQLNEDGVDLVRIQLEFTGQRAEKLSSWPWEYLHRRREEKKFHSGDFLALVTQLVLNRRLTPGTILSDTSLSTSPPVRVLLVAASPRDLTAVNASAVKTVIKELNRKSPLQGADLLIDLDDDLVEPPFELSEDYRPAASFAAFKKKIQTFKPHIVHFIGHGQRKPSGGGQLAFVGADGRKDWWDDEDFARAVAAVKGVKLVFLQACESALPDPYIGISGVARMVAHRDIPAVVAMQYKVEKEVADMFATTFYQALTQGMPVDLAVKIGRNAISDMQQIQSKAFGLPVLYLRNHEGMFASHPSGAGLDAIPCPKCGNKQPPKANFCETCRTQFRCLHCGKRIEAPLTASFCSSCGHQLGQAPAAQGAPERVVSPETVAHSKELLISTGSGTQRDADEGYRRWDRRLRD